MHPFVALMRTYCIDYTSSHDQSLYDEIMEPEYVVHIEGKELTRSTSYSDSVTSLFATAPGLDLVVHELVLEGDRLCMHFSEHGAFPHPDGPRLACWRGIGLYKWNGRRLTENWVEQDYQAMREQLASGDPHPLRSPHLDPWVTTKAVASDPAAEEVVRGWLAAGDIGAADQVEIDDGRRGVEYLSVVDVEEVTVNDLFSAGENVPFHVTFTGAYRGGLAAELDDLIGQPTVLNVAGIARVRAGRVAAVEAVTTRSLAARRLRRSVTGGSGERAGP